MYIPRGGLYVDGSSEVDLPNNYSNEIQSYRSLLKQEAYRLLDTSAEFNNIQKYIQYLEGSQWNRLRPKYKSRFVHNRLEQARRDRLALLTDSKPIIDVTSSVDSLKETSKIIANVIRAEWFKQDMDLSLVSVADIAMLWGTAYWKIGAASPGNMSIIPCGPDNVLPIQPGFHLQQSAAVLYRTWKNTSYFKRVFPYTSAGIEKFTANYTSADGGYVRPSGMSEYTWNGVGPGFQRIMGGKAGVDSAYPAVGIGAVELEEYYVTDDSVNESQKTVIVKDPYLGLDEHNWWYEVKPGQPLYPRKRLLVFGGKQLLYDGPSPYWHGLYPFACLRFNPVPWSFHGLSTYRSLIPLQESINDIGAGTMDIIKKALNPTLISKSGAVSGPSWKDFQTDMPGAKLLLGPMGNPATDIQYGQTPQLPAYVFDMLSRYLNPEFDKMSGIMDISTLAGKKQVPGGDTLDNLKDSLQTSLRLDMRFIEAFIRDSGTIAVSNVIQFYNTKRRLQLLGEDGITLEDFDFNGTNLIPAGERDDLFWKSFGFTIIPGSLHSGAHDKSKIENLTKARLGLLSKGEYLRREGLDPGDVDRIISELKDEAQSMAPPQGKSPQQPSQKNGNGPM